MPTMLRQSRALFRFAGPEALKLLFDVVTGRIVAERGPAVWWALLSPQGKMQAEGLCSFDGEAFFLDVDEGVADAFFKRMKMYRLRARVDIDDLRATHAVGWDPDGATGAADPRGLGSRVIATRDDAAWPDGEHDFGRRRIAAGIAVLGRDFAADTTFPHDIGMDLMHGVDFKKGCYIGQEVVSRMQHRGTARRRPVIVSGISASAGTPVVAGTREAGVVGEVIDGAAVASLRLDRITDPAAVTVGGAPATVALPTWATYRFGESAADD